MNKEFVSIIDKYKNREISLETAKSLLEQLKGNDGNEILDLDQPPQRAKSCRNEFEEIAVIGMSGQFPDASNCEEFWQNILQGHDAVRELPGEYLYDKTNDPRENYCKWAGILSEKYYFDPLFFNIAPVEAASMNLHQRIILQESWRGLEDAGYNPKSLSNSMTSVFIGAEPANFVNQSFTGYSDAIIAARLSYYLNFKGPALMINTACSSSATAIHLACESLQNGESTLAIAGGIFANLEMKGLKMMSEMQVLSPTGKCSPFDESANGTIISEGAAVVVLKRLSDAIKDGDNIYGVIKASGTNQDGTSNGITAPNGIAQEELIFNLYKKYKINPEDITHIEAHGTGTKLGDPVEANALIRAFKQFTKKTDFCNIGSAKSNIGHTGAASGAIGLIKILLSMRDHKLPGLIHYRKLNPMINFNGTPFHIYTENYEWKSDKPLLAALSSFGHAGTNVHMIISEYIKPVTNHENSNKAYLIPLSAKDGEALHEYAMKLYKFLKSPDNQNISMEKVAYTLQTGREEMNERVVFLARSLPDLVLAIEGFLNKKSDTKNIWYTRNDKQSIPFSSDLDMQETVNKWITNGKLAKVGEFWTLGFPVNWKLFTKNLKIEKVSLPSYPFSKEKYYLGNQEEPLGMVQTTQLTKQLHVLVQENTSNFMEQRYTSTFIGNEFFLTDHQFNNRKVLPGVAYLEIARAAVEAAVKTDEMDAVPFRLKHVFWFRPIIVNDNPVKIHISLRPSESRDILYDIYSLHATGETTVYCHGEAETFDMQPVEPEPLDIKELESRTWDTLIQADELYSSFEKVGVKFGLGHRGIETLYAGKSEVLARLTMPAHLIEESRDFVLHPSMMDGAFQSAIGLMMESGKAVMPFALDKLDIFGACVPSMWAYVTYSGRESKEEFDIKICDSSGKILVLVQGLLTRPVENAESQELLLLEPEWMEEKAIQLQPEIEYGRRLVFLCEPDGITSESFGSALKGVQCFILKPENKGDPIGKRYQKYTVQLIETIRDIFSQNLVQQVLVQIIVPSQEEKSLFTGLMGVLKTVQQENPLVSGHVILTDRMNDLSNLIEVIQENVFAGLDKRVSYINGKRMVEGLREIQINEANLNVSWKDKGVYLITGGVGGIGRIFAREIAQKAKDTMLVLTGRSPISAENEAWLKELNQAGTHAEFIKADVSNEEEVQKLFKTIADKFGRLNGIIHGAGVVRDNFIIKKNNEEVMEVLNPKVNGTVLLDKWSRNFGLDLFVLFSSMSGVGGNPGQADYAAASAFLDAFAEYRNRQLSLNKLPGKTIAIDWPQWKEGGMKIDEETEKMLFLKTGAGAMETKTGIRAFYLSLLQGKNQTMVMAGDIERIKEILFQKKAELPEIPTENVAPKEDMVISETDYSVFKEKTIMYLKKILSNTLKIPVQKIENQGSFEKYGIDSLIIMQLTTQLEKDFGVLSKTLFFEYQNVESLSDYFVRNQAAKLNSLFELKDKSGQKKEEEAPLSVSKPVAPGKMERLKWAVSSTKKQTETDIAIIGISGRYPGAKDIDALWDNLKNGRNSITEIPEDRWNWKEYFDEDKTKQGKIYTKWGGFIDGVDEFDPLFFNISPREAEIMDPQERLFLEHTYKAIEDAGYVKENLNRNPNCELGPKVGVYAGVMYEEYQLYGAQEQMLGRMFALSGSPSSIANRVSYAFNFQGPSMAVDTMCSSSLTAIHLACQSLEKGECGVAVAGGVNVSIHLNKYLILSYGKYASSKGQCESFGKGGDGYVPGEGVGVVILKLLSEAVKDEDHIYGVIKASELNAGGKTNGYTVPNPLAQAELVRNAIEKSGVNARFISYIEGHGTGTPLGDPIEIVGLTKAFRNYTQDKQFCAIGSIKSNIGHCESAAGVAALTKVLLQMKHRQLVPSLNSSELNPNINFEESPFYVQHELSDWNADGLRTAGISSFGAGGSNAHLIIQEFKGLDQKKLVQINEDNPALFLLSARDSDRLKELAESFLNKLTIKTFKDENLADMAYTLQTGRTAMDVRLGITASSIAELERKLKVFVSGEENDNDYYLGYVKQNNDTMSLFSSDDVMREAVDKWMHRKNFVKLMELWVKGLDVEWIKLYEGAVPRKISLPTYPFAREKYWIPISKNQNTAANIAVRNNTKSVVVNKRKTEKMVLVKDWYQKELLKNMSNKEGLVVVLASKATEKLAGQLFKEDANIKLITFVHGNPEGSSNTDFYSSVYGDKLYQKVVEKKGGDKLIGVIDLTAFDKVYESNFAVESGKIAFLQKLIENHRSEQFKLLQVTEELNPFQLKKTTLQGARLAGLYRMLSAEYKEIASMILDVDNKGKEHKQFIHIIQDELLNDDNRDCTELCYRNYLRYQSHMVVSKTDQEINDLKQTASDLKDKTVLITGGTRGIGAAISEHLVLQGLKNLVIFGREKLPEQQDWKASLAEEKDVSRIEKIKHLQSMLDRGVKILYFNTSLTDEQGLTKALEKIHKQIGSIHYVYHCAGLVNHTPAFIKKDIYDFETVCEPKMKGLEALYKTLSQEPLELFLLFSSISSIMPSLSVGQSDYAMANSFMDYFAQYQYTQGKTYVKAAQWPIWAEVGMSVTSAGMITPVLKNKGFVPLSTKTGMEFLKVIEQLSHPVLMPCVIDSELFKLDLLLNKGKNGGDAALIPARSKPLKVTSNSSGNDFESNVKHWLKETFMSELKLTESQIEEDKSFDEYGVDSIIIAQLSQILQKNVKTPLSPSLLLENRTIKDLTKYFVTKHPADLTIPMGQNDVSEDLSNEQDTEEVEYYEKSDDTVMNETGIHEEIAVVGISCRLPGADSKEAYWELLTSGKSAIKPLPEGRWQTRDGRIDYGGWVDNIDLFDADFFKLKDTDAGIMDPQARLILEESLKVICDAGYDYKNLSGSKTGVYIGGRSQPNLDVEQVLKANNPILGAGQNYLASNISRFFNFTGPGIVVDTACSSGLTALVMASDALKDGRIDMALIGAVSLLLNSFGHEMFSARNILSKNGEFHIFDKRSGGEVLGEGVGTLLLKRLSDAVKDGNTIYGVIKATAINNDGRTLGPGSPNLSTQKQVIQEALTKSGKAIEDIGYIEANGGGSPVVDSIEIKALSEVYQLQNLSLKPCPIGSIKPNVGHLLLTSGLAGLIRCLLSLHFKQIPPFLTAKEPINYYDFKTSRVLFNRENIPWDVMPGKVRTAVLDSFPDGGTNCNIVLEEFNSADGYVKKLNSIPVPVLNRKRFALSVIDIWGKESKEKPAISQEDNDMDDFKNKFRLK